MSPEKPRTALITGASGGVGRALALDLARDHRLLLVARNEPDLQRLAGEIGSLGHGNPVTVIGMDLARPQSPRCLFDTVRERRLRVDLLINNAGSGVYGAFAETSLDRELAMLRLNVEALTALTKLFLGPMLERRDGRVINLASLAAYQPGGPGTNLFLTNPEIVDDVIAFLGGG